MEEELQTSSQGACASELGGSVKRTKKHKHKSKVWDKVAWFSKKSRHKSQSSLYDLSPEGPLSEDDLSPASTSDSPTSFRFYNSADSSFNVENEKESYCKIPNLNPNSEVIEQSCLKPSVAKALFMQLEAVHLSSDIKEKHTWYKPKKKTSKISSPFYEFEDYDISFQKTLSVPEEMVVRSKCHCIACCGCSPRERLSGDCPVYRRGRCTSTTSLDRGLDVFQSVEQCDLDIRSDMAEVKPSTLPKQAKDSELRNINRVMPSSDKQQTYCDICVNCFKLKQSEDVNSYDSEGGMPVSKISPAIEESTCSASSIFSISPGSFLCECKSKLSSIEAGDEMKTPMTLSVPCSTSIAVPKATNDSSAPRPAKHKTINDTHCISYYDAPCSPSKFKQKADEMEDWFKNLNDDRKNAVLLRLFKHCGVPQKHHLCDALSTETHPHCPPNCQDRISWLPHSLVLEIFSYLEPESLGRASQVCKVWCNLANEASLWRKFCSNPKWRLSRSGEQKQIIQHMLPDGSVNWKRVFAERNHLRNNWLNGRCTVRTFEGHTQG